MNGSVRVLILAMDPGSRRKKAVRLAAYFLDEGRDVDLVTAERRGWNNLDERTRVHRLDEAEGRHPILWLENTLVVRLPRLAVRPFARLGRLGASLDRMQRRVGGVVHRRLFLPFYRHIRPLVLARLARRRVLRGIDMAQVERVVVVDPTAVPLAWRLARLHPNVTVTTSMRKTSETGK